MQMLPLADVLHRSIVLGLVGITGWGLYTGTRAHFHILEAGRRMLNFSVIRCILSD